MSQICRSANFRKFDVNNALAFFSLVAKTVPVPAHPHQVGASYLTQNSYLLVIHHFLKVGTEAALQCTDAQVVSADSGALNPNPKENDMKTIASSCFACIALLVGGTTTAEWSGSIGWANDNYYRGIFQAGSSTNGGINFQSSGFYAGTWAADVGDGLDVDGFYGKHAGISQDFAGESFIF